MIGLIQGLLESGVRRSGRVMSRVVLVTALLFATGLYGSPDLPGPLGIQEAHAADSRIEPAIAWATARLGSTDYNYWCLKFVQDAYQFGAGASITRYSTAKIAADATNAAANAGTEPPRGSFVYFSWWGTVGGVYANYGHVGISLGDGRIIHAMAPGGVQITSRSIGLSYIGWAAPNLSPPLTDWGSPPGAPAVTLTSPSTAALLTSTRVNLTASAENATRVYFSAYYCDTPGDPSSAKWHYIGDDTSSSGGWTVPWDLSSVPDQGYAPWGTVNICATAQGAGGEAKSYRVVEVARRSNMLNNASFDWGSTSYWKAGSGTIGMSIGATPDTPDMPAKEGKHYLVARSDSSASVCQDITRGVKPGESYTYSIWVRSASGEPVEGTLALWNLGKGERGATPFRIPGEGWHKVSVGLDATVAGTMLRAEAYVAPGVTYHFDGGQLQKAYLKNASFEHGDEEGWRTENAPGTFNVIVGADTPSSPARDGEHYLEFTTTENGGSLCQDIGIVPEVGSTYTYSIWVRSATGDPVSGTIAMWARGGTEEQRNTPFEVSGTGWHLISAPVSVVNSGHHSLRCEIYTSTGMVYHFDGAQLAKTRLGNSSFEYGDWSGWGAYGSPALSIKSNADTQKPKDGKHYLQVTSVSGGSIYRDAPIEPKPGETYTYSLWVRSPSGDSLTGKLQLWALGGTQESGYTLFDISGTDWNLITASVTPGNAGHTALRCELYLSTGKTYHIDGATLAGGNIGPDIAEDPTPQPPPPPDDDAAVVFERLQAQTRYETALAVSGEYGPGVAGVVLATGANFPDALCAAPLANAYGGPILLVPRSGLTEAIKAELERLMPTKVFVVGGTDVVPSSAETFARSLPGSPEVTRLAGPTRYETSVAIAEQLKVKLGDRTMAVVATGRNFPDALAVAPLAAAGGWPILLTNTAELPQVTREALSDLGVTSTVVVGGTGVVSESVKNTLPTPTRLSGANRYETCAAVAEYACDNGCSFGYVGVATGANFPDALSAGPLAGAKRGVLLLCTASALPACIETCVSEHASDVAEVDFFGGTDVVGKAVWDRVGQVVE